MDWLLIILEYLVFTLPVFIGLVVSFRWFLRSKSYEKILYIVSFFLPVVSILSLVKVFYIIELSVTPSAFVVANSIFAIGLLIFTIAIILQTNGRSLAKPDTIEILGVILLIASSLILKDRIKIIDYISWGLIGIITIHLGRGFAYSKYGRGREKRAYIVMCVFAGLSILLKLLFYLEKIPLKPTIYISLVLMFLALLHSVLIWWRVSTLMPIRNIADEVFKAKVSIFRRLIILSLLATIIVSGISYAGFYTYRREKARLTSDLELNVQRTLFTLNDKLNNYIVNEVETPLSYLASTLDLDNINRAKYEIEKFYETHKETIASVTLMNNEGIIVYTYPYTYSIGSDISPQPHVQEVLTKKQTVLSEPFRAVQGFDAIAIHIPLFKENEFFGTIAGLIDLKTLLRNLSISTPFQFVIAEDGIVVASNISNDVVLKNLQFVLASIPGKNTIMKSYSFTYRERFFEIYVIGDNSSIQEDLDRNFRNIVITYGFFILLFMLFFGLNLITMYETEKETTSKIEESVKKELEALEVYRTTQEKLNVLNEFIYGTLIETPIEEVVTKFLETIITLIPKIEKGVLWMTVSDKIVPAASIGYDTEILKKLVLDKSHEEKLWHSPTIIENIGVSGFSEELGDFAKALGLENIKETLIIPIIVQGHYAGHLSLDIFKEGVHFEESDIKLGNTISKIISFYIAIQGAFNALKKEVDINAKLASNLDDIITFISKTTFKEEEKEFFDNLLNLTLSLVESGEKGSVLLRKGDKVEYISAVGYDVKVLNEIFERSVEQEQQVVGVGETKIIKNIGLVGIKDEFINLARQMGIDKLTYTITASFFVDGVYAGGIFIDAFKEDMPFTGEDIEVMKAISNLGSLFIKTKRLIEDLIQELAVDNVVSKISKNLDPDLSTKEFATQVLKLVKQTFKEVEYVKACIELEGELVHLLVYNNSTKFVRTNLEKQEYIFEEEKLFENCAKVKYSTNIDTIEIGLSECDTGVANTINQLEIAILPALKSFFIYKDREKLFADMMIAFARAIDSKDPYTRLHSENVTKYAYFFGSSLNLDDNSIKKLVLSSILHDVGKIGVSESILGKPGKLNEYERAIIQIHPSISFEIISAIEGLKDVALIAKYHHERWDGKGYPDGLKGEEIPYLSRIIAIVDAFDAMTTDRPYRKALPIEQAIEEIRRNAGTQFDPELAMKFVKLKDKIIYARSIHIEEVLLRVLKIE